MPDDTPSPLDKFKATLEKTQKANADAQWQETEGLSLYLLAKVHEKHKGDAKPDFEGMADTYRKAVDTKLQLKNHPRLGYLTESERGLKPDFKKWVEQKVYGARAAGMKAQGGQAIQQRQVVGGVLGAASDLELMTEDGLKWSAMGEAQEKFLKGVDADVFTQYMRSEWGVDPSPIIAAGSEAAYKAAIPQLAGMALAGKKPTQEQLVEIIAQYL